ncbi:MAG TPA: hypothetical protein VHQ20_02270 [Patescibacteria group bacterium]|jgi:hypothetical protein|nr:hypothetical protein [Patescibacteria group bacterium]
MEIDKKYFDQQNKLTRKHFDVALKGSKEHFDKQFGELNNRIDSITNRVDGIANTMATKEDLKGFATKEDLKNFITKADLKEALENQTKELQNYTDEVGEAIIEALDAGFTKVNKRLSIVELRKVA